MKVLDPGHVYALNWLDGAPKGIIVDVTESNQELTPQVIEELRKDTHIFEETATLVFEHKPNRLIFVKREGEGYPGNKGHHAGTTIQEVMRALIERLQYVNKQEHHVANVMCIEYLRQCIWELEVRAAERHNREWPPKGALSVKARFIELAPTCIKCGHVGCGGECHP